MTEPSAHDSRLLFDVIEIATAAGARILDYSDGDVDVETKADDSPVTQADRDANQLITERLRVRTPEIPIIAEESDLPDYEERVNWTRFWLVDPLDGTKEFIHRNGEFTVNIALIEDGDPVLGVIYAPARERLYFAEASHGSFVM